MAVYTQVDADQLAAFLKAYDIGEPVAFKGIAEGVENSNYYLETRHVGDAPAHNPSGRYILTLFERRVNPAELPYFVSLKQHLSAKGFPCPRPVPARDGVALGELAGRSALIVTFLDGISPSRPTQGQCHAYGAAMARMHACLADFAGHRDNALGPTSWPALFNGREYETDSLAPGLSGLIRDDLAAIRMGWPAPFALPTGTIHADLFPDNAFFLGDDVSGVIDFYFACSDILAYDIAVGLNAWAFEPGGHFNYTKGRALLAGYQSVRPLSPAERLALPLLARGAAMRFFLTRLFDWTSTPAGALVRPKNPLDYADRLRFHRAAQGIADYGG